MIQKTAPRGLFTGVSRRSCFILNSRRLVLRECALRVEYMKQATKDSVQTILLNDPTVDNRNIGPALDVLSGRTTVQIFAGTVDYTLSRRQAAELLGVSLRTLDSLGKKGLIKKAWLLGRTRARGYSLQSVREYQSERLVHK